MTGPRIAFRCDGGEQVGAGHVARSIPIARAFGERGWDPVFVGRYDGLAAWLLERAGCATEAPRPGVPVGVAAGFWSAAIADGYGFAEPELCALAEELPLATIAEAARCPRAGVLVDYHLDRAGEEPGRRILPGPEYAPVDPAFIDGRREREPVRTLLVTVGGSEAARRITAKLVDQAELAFPGARVRVAGGGAGPDSLLDLIREADAAVSGAGLTAYELACAGVPAVVVALAENQRRVARACEAAGVAIGLEDPGELAPALMRLADPVTRAALAATGPVVVDGHGAARVAEALDGLWRSQVPR